MENEFECTVLIRMDNRQESVFFEHLADYNLWCCHAVGKEYFHGEGETPEEALLDLIAEVPRAIERLRIVHGYNKEPIVEAR